MSDDPTVTAIGGGATAVSSTQVVVDEDIRALVKDLCSTEDAEKEVLEALSRQGLASSCLIGNLSETFLEKACDGLSVAAAAALRALAADVAAFVKKRRKVAIDTQFKQNGPAADVKQLMAAVAASYKTVLPPSALHGISSDMVSQVACKESAHFLPLRSLLPKDPAIDPAEDKLFNFSVSRAERSENPFLASNKSKKIGSLGEFVHCLLRYALLVAAVVSPDDLSALDVISYLLRVLSLSGSLSLDELLLYDEKYRRAVASLVAASSELSVRKCFISDAYPTLLAKFSFNRSRAVPPPPAKAGNNADRDKPKSRKVCYDFQRDGKCRYGNGCRFRHASGPHSEGTESRGSRGSPGASHRAADKGEKRSPSGPDLESVKSGHHVAELRQRAAAVVAERVDLSGFQDGTGLCAAKPSAFAAVPCVDGLGAVTALFCEAASTLDRSGVLLGLSGPPTPEQCDRLQEAFCTAIESLVPRLCDLLNCSGESAQCGSPIRAKLGSAIASVTHDPDVHLFSDIDVGLNLGVEPPVRATGVFPPAKSKKDVDKAMEVFNLKRAYHNFSSVELLPEVCRAILSKEVALGRMRRMSFAQASRSTHRLYARMALIPKSGGDYRLIEAHSGSGLNAKCTLCETCSLPRYCDIREGLADLLARDSPTPSCHCCRGRDGVVRKSPEYRFLKYDIASAYRHLFLKESDRARASVRLESEVFENLALPFGAGTSPFHWCRTSAALCRMVASILKCAFGHSKVLSLIYVDDGLLALPEGLEAMGSIITFLVWRCLNFEINWAKCLFSVSSVKFIRFEVSLLPGRGASVKVHPDIFGSIRDILLSFIDNRRVTPAPLSKVIGKLLFASQSMRHLKGFLQPLYALLNVFEKKHLRTMRLSPSSGAFGAMRFWLGIAENPAPCPLLCSSVFGPGSLVAASDASTDFMSGWVSDGSSGVWFQLGTESLGQWCEYLSGVQPLVSPSHRDIALLELLAAVVTLSLSLSWPSPTAIPTRVVLFCDNSGVVGVLKKLYSPKPALAAVLRGVSRWFGRLGDSLVLSHIASTENWLADGISRGRVPSLLCSKSPNPAISTPRLFPPASTPQSLTPLSRPLPRQSGNSKRDDVRNFITQFTRAEMSALAESFAHSGLAQSTNSLYDSTVTFFEDVIGGNAFPLSVQDLSVFVWALSSCNYAYNTISTYVSALRSRNKSAGFWLTPSEDFQVSHILKAAKKLVGGECVRKMKPITKSELFEVFRNVPPRSDLASEAMLLGIFAMLRADELLNLRWSDLTFSYDSDGSPVHLLNVRIRRSKTDQCGVGQLAYVACLSEAASSLGIHDLESNACELCPYHLLYGRRPASAGCEERVFPLEYDAFLDSVRRRLGPVIGLDVVADYGTHTLRRTGAQLLHRNWAADSPAFMRAGRWRSSAVLEYLHDSAEEKAKVASWYMLAG
ncbi:hypothetical protein FOL47_007471 [Perkinsus chesapeaki]|uniref:C3H1-type domain-containing protein n=1 Tax=Perkinsus chesapeaki TaxID=330153 RepID=A0A7J6LKS9_PERCH|nr:hypothetical protein FOL47_007471 [Perkinsus chesapeaki]